MPSYRATDDIQSWFRGVIIEEFEAGCEEYREAIKKICEEDNYAEFREYCEEMLELSADIKGALREALFNCVEWDRLMENCAEDIADFEDSEKST